MTTTIPIFIAGLIVLILGADLLVRGASRLTAAFDGNGTIGGATTNIIVTKLSEKTRTPITSKLWNKRGLPVMIAACTISSILYALMYPLF